MRPTMGAILSLAVVLTSSCSNARDTRISETNQDTIIKAIADSGELSPEEQALLAGYLLRFDSGQTEFSPVGKTIADLIEEQRSFLAGQDYVKQSRKEAEAAARERREAQAAEQERLKPQQRAREEALAFSLQDSVVFAVLEERVVGSSGPGYDSDISLGFRNVSGKNVRFFTGTVFLNQTPDLPYYSSPIRLNGVFKPGATAVATIKVNHPDREPLLHRVKVVWLMQTIDFEDGTVLDASRR